MNKRSTIEDIEKKLKQIKFLKQYNKEFSGYVGWNNGIVGGEMLHATPVDARGIFTMFADRMEFNPYDSIEIECSYRKWREQLVEIIDWGEMDAGIEEFNARIEAGIQDDKINSLKAENEALKAENEALKAQST